MLGANVATNANLKDKKNLDTLVLKWDDGLQDAQVAKEILNMLRPEILNMLRPHVTLKTLSIEGYVGETFPTWLGDLSFSNLVDLRIERCGKCTLLPAFGQLPSLKRLIIKKMDEVQMVGREFYGQLEQPFQSLEKLCFEDMPKWEGWSPDLTSLSSRDTIPTTPKVLELVDCPKLKSIVDELKKDTFLEEFVIKCCEKLSCLPRGLHRLSHLKKITIHDCKSLKSLGNLPAKLRSLEIEDCEKLEALSENMDDVRELRELRLSGANLCEQVFELRLYRLTQANSCSVAVEASFKTWRRLHIMLRNNDSIREFKVFLCSQPANRLRNFLKTGKIKTRHYAKMTSNYYMNIFWSSASSY
ncbi:hypothetical protein CMV_025050 [Castanea mollissima]|uniref:R13L1/DRL21-like LRR repeat region domain-containing protein n=1 Tax=Castanea mollissima TaxID=60419 RepID=A0A8J4QE65_9ROSI|nr:hypothetical protein CMV_025050 [Castanea mollissima]